MTFSTTKTLHTSATCLQTWTKFAIQKNCNTWPTCSNQWKQAQYVTSTQKNLAKNCKIDWPIELFENDPFPTESIGVLEEKMLDRFDRIAVKRKLICHGEKKNLEMKIGKNNECLINNTKLIHPIPIKKIILDKSIKSKSPKPSPSKNFINEIIIQNSTQQTMPNSPKPYDTQSTKSTNSQSSTNSIETIIGLEEDFNQKLLQTKEQKSKFYKQNSTSSVDSFLKFNSQHNCGAASPSSMSTGSGTSGYQSSMSNGSSSSSGYPSSSCNTDRKRSYQSLIDLTDENFGNECGDRVGSTIGVGQQGKIYTSKNSSFRKVERILNEIIFPEEAPYVYYGNSFEEIKKLFVGQYYDDKHKIHWRITDIISLLSLLKLFGANSYTLIKDLNLPRFQRFKRSELKAKFQSLEKSNHLTTINFDTKIKTFKILNNTLEQVVGVNSSRQKVFIISNLDRFGNNLYKKIIG